VSDEEDADVVPPPPVIGVGTLLLLTPFESLDFVTFEDDSCDFVVDLGEGSDFVVDVGEGSDFIALGDGSDEAEFEIVEFFCMLIGGTGVISEVVFEGAILARGEARKEDCVRRGVD
jgi:hypothetical protein